MRKLLLTAVMILCLVGCTKQPRSVVIVSLDAFRWDYPDMYDTPNLDRICENGLRTVMEPSFPASTFPNHYAIATGLVPDHNGIVNNSFWDSFMGEVYSMGDSASRYNPFYYLGEPIWVTAEKQGVKTANIHWVGSDVAVGNTYPSIYLNWNDEPRRTYEERVDYALELMNNPARKRPGLLMVYFDDPDAVSHEFGPESPETGIMVHYLDSLMGILYDGLTNIGDIDLIVTADHGMTEVSPDRFINWNDHLKPSWYHHILGTIPTNIYVNEGCKDSVINALADIEHISVWEHKQVPDSLKYGTLYRTGDVIVAPDLGWQFADAPATYIGKHGFAPQEPDMQVIFYAAGPSIAHKGNTVGEYTGGHAAFKNVDIYSLLAKMLNITPTLTDGYLDRISWVLE